MSFRTLQKMEQFSAGKIVYTYLQPNKDGVSEAVDVDQCSKLPDVELTDLGASLKAGINLQQVNCKLVNGSNAVASLDSALAKASKKSATTSEVNDAE